LHFGQGESPVHQDDERAPLFRREGHHDTVPSPAKLNAVRALAGVVEELVGHPPLLARLECL
jgi:hypothetical protein